MSRILLSDHNIYQGLFFKFMMYHSLSIHFSIPLVCSVQVWKIFNRGYKNSPPHYYLNSFCIKIGFWSCHLTGILATITHLHAHTYISQWRGRLLLRTTATRLQWEREFLQIGMGVGEKNYFQKALGDIQIREWARMG